MSKLSKGLAVGQHRRWLPSDPKKVDCQWLSCQLSIMDQTSMVSLLSKERHDHRRYTVKQPAGRRSGSAMVNNSRDLLKQVFMGAITNVKDIGVLVALELTPPLGYYGPNSGCFDCLEDHYHQSGWVIDNNASESDVDRLRSAFEKSCEIFRGLVRGGLSKKEARDT